MEKLKFALSSLGLGESEVIYIGSRFSLQTYVKNEYLLQIGQVAHKLFFIEKGSVILGNETADQLLTRHMAQENEFITSLESFTKQTPSSEFLKATQPLQVYAISKTDFVQLARSYQAVETFYQQVIFDTLLKCQQRIRDLISLDAKAYYEQLQQHHPEFVQHMPQYELASYMGIEPQSLSRLRKAAGGK